MNYKGRWSKSRYIVMCVLCEWMFRYRSLYGLFCVHTVLNHQNNFRFFAWKQWRRLPTLQSDHRHGNSPQSHRNTRWRCDGYGPLHPPRRERTAALSNSPPTINGDRGRVSVCFRRHSARHNGPITPESDGDRVHETGLCRGGGRHAVRPHRAARRATRGGRGVRGRISTAVRGNGFLRRCHDGGGGGVFHRGGEDVCPTATGAGGQAAGDQAVVVVVVAGGWTSGGFTGATADEKSAGGSGGRKWRGNGESDSGTVASGAERDDRPFAPSRPGGWRRRILTCETKPSHKLNISFSKMPHWIHSLCTSITWLLCTLCDSYVHQVYNCVQGFMESSVY